MSVDNIITIIVVFIVFFGTYRKKAKQVGKTWDGPLSAKVTLRDKELHCVHCGHDKFKKREGLVATTWVTFFRFSFWNQSARCYVCSNCGNVHWFISPEEKAEIVRDYQD